MEPHVAKGCPGAREGGGGRGFLCALACFLGDVNTARKGPGAMARRGARRGAGKATGRLLRWLLG